MSHTGGTIRRTTTAALLVLALHAALHGPAAAAHASLPEEAQVARQLAAVRRATAPYHDLQRAVDDGYQPASPCVPGMGFHYLRSVAADAEELDPLVPDILVYAPQPGGALRLVAVEYASWAPAELFGQAFDPPHAGGPPFHTLHAWIWRGNPDGVFTPANPTVACP